MGAQKLTQAGRLEGKGRERWTRRGRRTQSQMGTYAPYRPSRVCAHTCTQSRTHHHTLGYKRTVTPSDTHTHVHAHRATHTQSHSIVTHTKDRPGEEPEDAGTEPLARGALHTHQTPAAPRSPSEAPRCCRPRRPRSAHCSGPPLPAAQSQSHQVCWPAPE